MKNEIPIGNSSDGTANVPAPIDVKPAFTFPTRKPAYLNVISDSKFNPTIPASRSLACRVPPEPFDPDRGGGVDEDRSEDDPGERAAVAGVEDDAGDNQQRVPRAGRRHVIDGEENGQEPEEESRLGEQHRATRPSTWLGAT